MALKDFVVSRNYLVLLFESEQSHQPGKIEAALVFIETEFWQIVAVSRPPGDVAEINQAGTTLHRRNRREIKPRRPDQRFEYFISADIVS